MSVVHIIDTLAEWAQSTICTQIKLKVPPENTDANDEGYVYTLAAPAAFAMYTPTSEKLPPRIHTPFPALCVQLVAGADHLADGTGETLVQFCFATWDPGIHGKDQLRLSGDGSIYPWSEDEAAHYFRRSGEGWRDAWNFVDIALREVERVTHVGGYLIDRTKPIKFGPVTEQESIVDFYPMWYAWLSFTIEYPLQRNMQDVQKFL